MKKKILLAAAVASAMAMQAETPRWLRQAAISPDGKTVAFAYQGDIYTVSSQGGEARQLTTNAAYDQLPCWSPDGTRIAFASDRSGHMDIYTIPAQGGTPEQLTHSPYKETPIAWKDAETILYSSNVMPSTEDMQFPGSFAQVYEVKTTAGHHHRMVSSMPMEHISINAEGKWLYHDFKGYEHHLRKHHTSSVTRDVWTWTPVSNKYTKLTTFVGEDREPVWGNDGAFYYLSEEGGNFNVYKKASATAQPQQLTKLPTHPIRSLSRANTGTMCFSYNGDLYTLQEGNEPKKLDIQLNNDTQEKQLQRQILRSGVTDFSVSKDGKQVAFVVHGDVFVTSTEFSTTRQITDTPDQERSVSFAPDGKSVVYASERNGLWQIYQASIEDKDGKSLVYAKNIKEKNITNTDQTSFLPKFSPDGEKVAYLENRTTRRVIDLKSGKIVTALDGKFNYSYQDGDQEFEWSPDSKWLLTNYIGIGGWNNTDIALVKADGKEIHNLTNSGYSDSNAQWVLGGKAMVWTSDRAGYRSHGSWGAENDFYIMFFDVEAYDRFRMNKEDISLMEENKTDKEKKKEEKEEEKADKDKPKDVEDLTFDLDFIDDRIIRLTGKSGSMGAAAFDKKGRNFYYTASYGRSFDLWKYNLDDQSTKRQIEGLNSREFQLDKNGETAFFTQGGQLRKMKLGAISSETISFEALFNYRPAQERAYMFDHCWRQVNEKFYDPKIHGIDWMMFRKNYEQFLPYINNNYDFADLLSEMLGELNGSHTGSGYRAGNSELSVGRLGLFYDDTYTGHGLRIKEIISRSPLAQKKNDIKPGMIITHINGVELTDGMDADYLLAGQIGKNVTLSIANKEGGKTTDIEVKPISSGSETELLYHRWVERNRKIVEERTNGKIGYIHIKSMNGESFHTLYSELLGRYRNTDAVIIDTRHNGGGWLHDDVVTLLGAKEYVRYTPRGQYIGSDPFNKYTKPSCMLICEDNYSNAHGTPWLYKELGIGKLIGAPVPGTMTAVWWETQIDPTIYFGIPQVGSLDRRGHFLENQQLEPDILIYNAPADVLQGKDAQLDAAIDEMLKQTTK